MDGEFGGALLVGEKMIENEEKSWPMNVPCNSLRPGHFLGIDSR